MIALSLGALLWLASPVRAALSPEEQKFHDIAVGKGLGPSLLMPADITKLGVGLKISTGLAAEEHYLPEAARQNFWLISDRIRERIYRTKVNGTGAIHQFFDDDGAVYKHERALAAIQVMVYFFPLNELDHLDSGVDTHASWEATYQKLLTPGAGGGYRPCGPVVLPDQDQFVINGVFYKPAAADQRLDSWSEQGGPTDAYEIYLKRKGSFWIVRMTVSGQSQDTIRQRQLLLEEARQTDFAGVSNQVVGTTFLTEDLARRIAAVVAQKFK